MKDKISLILFICIIFPFYSISQNLKSIFFIDFNTKEPIDFLQLISECNQHEVLYSDIKGNCIFDLKLNECNKWSTNHLSYELITIDLINIQNLDTVKLNPKSYIIDSIQITSKKQDNQYLFDLVNQLLAEQRLESKFESNYYFYKLNSKTNQTVREEIRAYFKIPYSHKSGFISEGKELLKGNFWYKPDAIFLNINTENLLFSFSPFRVIKNNYSLPLNEKKITKKKFQIKRLVCNYCKQSEHLLEILSIQENVRSVLLFDYITLKPVEYFIEFNKNGDSFFKRLNQENVGVEKLIIRYIFNNFNIEILEFEINLNLKNENVKTFGVLKNVNRHIQKQHNILGNYESDNLYEEISISIPDSLKLKELKTSDFDISFITNDSNTLESLSKDVLEPFLELPSSHNKFIIHGNERLNSFDYKSSLVQKEYWFYQYEKYIPNSTLLRLNWTYKIINNDSSIIVVESLPTLWNSKKSIIQSTYLDTAYFNFCVNLVYDWVEFKRKELFTKTLIDILNCYDKNYVDSFINSTFKLINNQAQEYIIKLVENKMNFNQIDELNNKILNDIGIDNILLYFKHEINAILSDNNYRSFIDQYNKSGYLYRIKNPEFYKHCIARTTLLYDELIYYYKSNTNFDKRKLGSFYGLQAEAYIIIENKEKACYCLKNYIRFWPEAINVSLLKKEYYYKQCK